MKYLKISTDGFVKVVTEISKEDSDSMIFKFYKGNFYILAVYDEQGKHLFEKLEVQTDKSESKGAVAIGWF
jgi:hypothetical protein